MQKLLLIFSYLFLINILGCSPVVDTPSATIDEKAGISEETTLELNKENNNWNKDRLQKSLKNIKWAANEKIKSNQIIKEGLNQIEDSLQKEDIKYSDFYSNFKNLVKDSSKTNIYETNKFIDTIREKGEGKKDYDLTKIVEDNIIKPFKDNLKKKDKEKDKSLYGKLKTFSMFAKIDKNFKKKKDKEKDKWINENLKAEKDIFDLKDLEEISRALPTNFELSNETLKNHFSKINSLKKARNLFIDLSDKEKIKIKKKDLEVLFDLLLSTKFKDTLDDFDEYSIKKINTKEELIETIVRKIKKKINYFNVDNIIIEIKDLENKIPDSFKKLKNEINKILDLNKSIKELNKLDYIPTGRFLPRDRDWLIYEFTYYAQNLKNSNKINEVISQFKKLKINENLKKDLNNILNAENDYFIEKDKILKKIPEYKEPGSIPNDGNTCYAASILQILARALPEPFYLYELNLKRSERLISKIKKIDFYGGINFNESDLKKIKLGKKIIQKIKSIINDIRKGKTSNEIGNLIDIFKASSSKDVSELGKKFNWPPIIETSDDGTFTRGARNMEDSEEFLRQIFLAIYNTIKSYLIVEQTKIDKNNFIKNYSDRTLLALNLGNKNTSLEELLEQNYGSNFKKQKDTAKRWINGVYKNIDNLKSELINDEDLDDILLIHLRRYKKENNIRTKNDILVEMPEYLTIKKELTKTQKKDLKYKLITFNVHRGSLEGGHYVAYIENNKKWFGMSDATKEGENMEYKDVTESNQGYLYFYKKVI